MTRDYETEERATLPVLSVEELKKLPPIPPCPVCGRSFARVMPHAQYHGNVVECDMGHKWDARV